MTMPEGFEEATVALTNFSQLYGAYKVACDVETMRNAEKVSADAALALATAEKDQADAAAEQAMTAMLDALAKIGLKPLVVVPPPPPVA